MTNFTTGTEKNRSSRFPGKIAIITTIASINEDDYHSAELLVEKYGADKIVHMTGSGSFITDMKKTIDIVAKLEKDREINALIINQALPGANALVRKIKETRADLFIIYCSVHDDFAAAAECANLLFEPNELDMGPEMVRQAKKQGAKTFVHYSFARHMAMKILADRRDLMKKVCEAEGILFIDTTIPDPMKEAGFSVARQFILDDVPRVSSEHGEDTAFFCTNCHLQASLIKAVVDSHAIYPQPCCPSPYHGFPQAFGIDSGGGMSNLNNLITELCNLAAEKKMTDRLSTWPVSASMMFANAGAEYAIKWMNGEVKKNRIDDKVLKELMNSYIKEVIGEGVEVTITSYSENGVVYDNFKLVLMSYLNL